ncbi:hypothetical protein EV702DRAFT_1107794, partial [Suillus placidus]
MSGTIGQRTSVSSGCRRRRDEPKVECIQYPAAGIEGLYRNRREDAQHFLPAQPHESFWRTSKSLPTPPLAILLLVSREIHALVTDSNDQVAVLHCKAGKGRSGTL